MGFGVAPAPADWQRRGTLRFAILRRLAKDELILDPAAPTARPTAPEPDERPPSSSRLEAWAPMLCALVAGLVTAGMLLETRDFALDDAWIHLAYAKSARLGDGISYNPGDWETGFSSPLWVALLTVWPLAEDPVLPVKLLGLLLHAATAWVATDVLAGILRKRATHERPLPVFVLATLGGLLVATTPTLVQGASSGMEVPLAALLVVVALRCMLGGSWVACLLAGAGASLARPEALFAIGGVGLVLLCSAWRSSTRPRPVKPPLACCGGAVLGLLAWFLYCLVVSGSLLPNTQVVKGGLHFAAANFDYIAVEVLPWQPWLVSLTGLGLIAWAVRSDLGQRHPEAPALAAGFVLFVLATGVTRTLHPGVQFYESRYFAIAAALPSMIIPLGLAALARPTTGVAARWRAPLLAAAVLPIGALSALQLTQLHDAQKASTEDTYLVHSQVARYVDQTLPADAVVGVEGAGAIRFHAPRSMTVVDLVGLNDHQSARLYNDRSAKTCYLISRELTHLVVPADWGPQFADIFAMRPLQVFSDPRYTQVRPARPLDILVLEVVDVRPRWAQRCAQ